MNSRIPFYTGEDEQVPRGEADYQTVAMQELLHAVGLLHHHEGEYADVGGDGHSVMHPELKPGHAHRTLSQHDLRELRMLYNARTPQAQGAQPEAPEAPGHKH